MCHRAERSIAPRARRADPPTPRQRASSRRRSWRSDERGNAVLAVTLWSLTVLLVLAALARAGAHAVSSARAQAGADAVALAEAAAGPATGRVVARLNGVTVIERAPSGAGIDVRVEIGGRRAVARAERLVGAARPSGVPAGLPAAMVAAIVRTGQLLGEPVRVVDVGPAGAWIRVAAAQEPALVALGADAPLCYPLPVGHPVHFVTCPSPA